MALLWKDVLWPGRWVWPDGRSLTLRPDDVRRAHRNGRRMLARRLDVPACWEHQPDAYPRPVELSSAVYGSPDRRAAWARNVIAPVKAFEVREQVRGGRRVPVLFAGIDTARLTPADLDRVKTAGKVSCRVDVRFSDARNGEVYPGYSVSHVAVTPKPLEPDQGPFLMSRGPAARTYYLGHGSRPMPKPDHDQTPPPADELEGIDEGGGPAPDPEPDGDEADGGDLQALIAALRDAGLTIPDEVEDLKHLIIAVKACGKPKPDADPMAAATQPAGGGAPLMMSQAAMAEKYPDRVENDRRNLRAMISLAFKDGQIPGDFADELKRELEGFELSYAPTGAVADTDLVQRVKAYRKLPKGMLIAKKQPKSHELSHAGRTQRSDPPGHLTGRETLDDVVKRQEELAKQLSAAPK